ncbi:ribosomal small subunit pseudouridine synthase A [Alteribacillus persepolensis]|uniref:Pseudouridine synthase n=1 Tax=Alteribacillus persepolensis TaxID=568899 RepID=A0A1G8E4F6_9BACI|nr:pseudouridine synthase [Alteribacillus persepolensis]SDH64519.1 ribosomal small subunit pseudouridine synthase A [Alteribacillus persepolensis]
MRIDKLLANSGYGSRKEVKQLLKQGAVEVDGKKAKNGSVHVNPESEEVTVLGEVLEYREFIYLLMNKPQGVISATVDDMHETVIDLLEMEDAVRDPFPVGRLDKDTEGLILLTNDGKFSHALTSPKKGVKKTYEATIDQEVTEADVNTFRKGVVLDDGYQTKPAQLIRKDPAAEVALTITEGKFHQVKRMFEAVGKKVLYLKRVEIGSLALDESLEPGEYRDMTKEEVEMLFEEAYSNQK